MVDEKPKEVGVDGEAGLEKYETVKIVKKWAISCLCSQHNPVRL